MFRKRQKKLFPPGTFIPTPARVCAIIQLCLAFSLFLWIASEPFVGEIFTLKSRQLFYQDLMGVSSNDNITAEKAERLERNEERFKTLPKQKQYEMIQGYQGIQKQLQRSFGDKAKSLFDLFFHQVSPFELAWMFFSVVIAVMLLKRVEGASQAVWLLPVLVALYAADSHFYTKNGQMAEDARLFPSEKELVDNYLKEPLRENIFEQQEQLMEGWKRYLVLNWTQHTPSKEKMVFEKQAEDGEFNFTLARLELRAAQDNSPFIIKTNPPPSLWWLAIYFFWNVYFAYTAWKYV